MYDDTMKGVSDEERDEQQHKCNLVTLPEDEFEKNDSEISQIKATPDGRFILVGFRAYNKILFFSLDAKEVTMTAIQPVINVS